jgi:hypothetical protein
LFHETTNAKSTDRSPGGRGDVAADPRQSACGNHLVQRYFPNASHQVVILSTDTEVGRRYYDELAPYIARAYHLKYDEARKMTVAEEGHFWIRDEDG